MTGSHRARLVVIALLASAADALTKIGAVQWLADPVELPGLTLRVTRNSGIAFGLGADQPAAVVLAVTGLAVAALAVAAWRGQLGGPAPSGLVLGGGVANLVDRAIGGSVVDVFDLGWWPVFNLADVFIVAGVGLLLLAAIAHDRDPDVSEGPASTTETPVSGKPRRTTIPRSPSG